MSGPTPHQIGFGNIQIGDPGPADGPFNDVRDCLVELPFFGGHGYATLDLFPVRQKIISELVPWPRSVFEFGSLLGYFLVTACHAAPEIERIGWIDPQVDVPNSNELCSGNVYGYWKKHRNADPEQVWFNTETRHCRQFGQADLVQVDGAHSYTDCIADLFWALELQPKTIFVDDYKAIDVVKEATDDFAKFQKLEVEYHETVNGLAVLRLDASPDGTANYVR